MAISRKTVCITWIALGFGLVIAGGLTSLYVVPAIRQVSERIPLSLLSVVAVLAGIFLIVRFALKLEDVGGPVQEIHIPGLDTDVRSTGEPAK
jgi:hypothetical protein